MQGDDACGTGCNTRGIGYPYEGRIIFVRVDVLTGDAFKYTLKSAVVSPYSCAMIQRPYTVPFLNDCVLEDQSAMSSMQTSLAPRRRSHITQPLKQPLKIMDRSVRPTHGLLRLRMSSLWWTRYTETSATSSRHTSWPMIGRLPRTQSSGSCLRLRV